MCCGSSTRTAQGGSIAVLQPTHSHVSQNHQDLDEQLRLFFSNQSTSEYASGTLVELKGLKRSRQGNYWITIHRDGDLSTSTSPRQQPPTPFLSFPLEPNHASGMQLRQRLDLGVGDAGIIGRRVSVATGSMSDPMTVAEGIIGWN